MEVTIDKCRIVYESWQMQCCGEPLHLGQKVELLSCNYKQNLDDNDSYLFDFLEEHHHGYSLKLTGIIQSLSAVFVEEYSQGTTLMNHPDNKFVEIPITKIDRYGADINDSRFKPNGAMDYHVTLRDVSVTLPEAQLTDSFSFIIEQFSFGTNEFIMDFGGFRFKSHATYIGEEPLSSLISGIHEMETDGCEDTPYYLSWQQEPGSIALTFLKDANSDNLHITIRHNSSGTIDVVNATIFKVQMKLSEFKSGLVKSGLAALKKYGINGFNRNWSSGANTFPVASLIYLLGTTTHYFAKDESFISNSIDELTLLLQNIKDQ